MHNRQRLVLFARARDGGRAGEGWLVSSVRGRVEKIARQKGFQSTSGWSYQLAIEAFIAEPAAVLARQQSINTVSVSKRGRRACCAD